MKKYQGALIAGLMAVSLAACSDMNMNGGGTSAGMAGSGTRSTPADNAAATDRTNGSNGGGADNSMGNNAATGNSGVGSSNR